MSKESGALSPRGVPPSIGAPARVAGWGEKVAFWPQAQGPEGPRLEPKWRHPPLSAIFHVIKQI